MAHSHLEKNSSSGATHGSLLERVRHHDAVAWNELVDLYGPLIAHWCGRCGLQSHETADCVQDVFFAVHRNLATYRPQAASGSFRAWLWTITRNKIRDTLRKSHWPAAGGTTALGNLQQLADDHELGIEEPSFYEPSIDEPGSHEDIQSLVTRALKQIQIEFEARTWAIFHRSVIDQVSTNLVAEEYQVTAANVRKVRSRILHRLREQLGDL